MQISGFDTFKEMKKNYCWTAQDIKEEILYTAQHFINKEYKELCEKYNGWENIPYEISSSTVDIFVDGRLKKNFEDITYGTFKKMVMNNLK